MNEYEPGCSGAWPPPEAAGLIHDAVTLNALRVAARQGGWVSGLIGLLLDIPTPKPPADNLHAPGKGQIEAVADLAGLTDEQREQWRKVVLTAGLARLTRSHAGWLVAR